MNTTIIGTLTQISATDGNYLTESYPTNFHSFVTKKILVSSDSIDNYKEVTPDEKAKLEEADAKWTEPPKSFIDQWNVACNIGNKQYGKYNESTGYFELNGLTDITYDQALYVMIDSDQKRSDKQFYYSKARTLIPVDVQDSLRNRFNFDHNIEIITLLNYYIINNNEDPNIRSIDINNTRDCFNQCDKLKELKGIIRLNSSDELKTHFYNSFGGRCGLEIIWIKGIVYSFKLALHHIKQECIKYMITNAANTSDITISVYPDVYAKLTGDTTNDAYNNLTEEEKAAWTQLVTDAAAKQISFVTV